MLLPFTGRVVTKPTKRQHAIRNRYCILTRTAQEFRIAARYASWSLQGTPPHSIIPLSQPKGPGCTNQSGVASLVCFHHCYTHLLPIALVKGLNDSP